MTWDTEKRNLQFLFNENMEKMNNNKLKEIMEIEDHEEGGQEDLRAKLLGGEQETVFDDFNKKTKGGDENF